MQTRLRVNKSNRYSLSNLRSLSRSFTLLITIACLLLGRRTPFLAWTGFSRVSFYSRVVVEAFSQTPASRRKFSGCGRLTFARQTRIMAPSRRLQSKKSSSVEESSSPKKRAAKSSSSDDETSDSKPPPKRRQGSKKNTKTSPTENMETQPKRAKKVTHQELTERDELPKLWDQSKAKTNGSYTFKIASWNVAGLRALLKKMPDALSELCDKHDLDVLCLQETKLQEMHLDDPKLKLRGHLLQEYDSYYSCSTTTKGYSGTAVFVRRVNGKKSATKEKQTTLENFFNSSSSSGSQQEETTTSKPARALPIDATNLVPQQVSFELGKESHDSEGRLVILDFPLFSMINVYVPNSGQQLKRLSYRTEEWDKDFLAFVQEKQANRSVPVMWLGDLNIAHTNLEVWNDGAKHLVKQAGVTPQERESFQGQLDAGFIDAFRHLHPEAKGHYSYWSTRAGNRPVNRGLRLDYFVCDPLFFDESSKVVVRDSYMDHDQLGSDHCPVILELEIKP